MKWANAWLLFQAQIWRILRHFGQALNTLCGLGAWPQFTFLAGAYSHLTTLQIFFASNPLFFLFLPLSFGLVGIFYGGRRFHLVHSCVLLCSFCCQLPVELALQTGWPQLHLFCQLTQTLDHTSNESSWFNHQFCAFLTNYESPLGCLKFSCPVYSRTTVPWPCCMEYGLLGLLRVYWIYQTPEQHQPGKFEVRWWEWLWIAPIWNLHQKFNLQQFWNFAFKAMHKQLQNQKRARAQLHPPEWKRQEGYASQRGIGWLMYFQALPCPRPPHPRAAVWYHLTISQICKLVWHWLWFTKMDETSWLQNLAALSACIFYAFAERGQQEDLAGKRGEGGGGGGYPFADINNSIYIHVPKIREGGITSRINTEASLTVVISIHTSRWW